MNSTYDLLRLMPLLQGISFEDFTRILEKCPFDFRKVEAGEVVARQGDTCQELLYLIKGTFSVTTEREKFTMEEQVSGPLLIEPYSLMGYSGNYVSTYRAEGFGDAAFTSYNAVRAAIGIQADGSLLILTANTSLPKLSQIMVSLGCVDAINFDGGGSTNLYVDGQWLYGPQERLLNTLLYFK